MNEEELELEGEEEVEKKPTGQQFDAEVLRSMINTGENQTGMVTIEPEDGIDPETDKPLFSKIDKKNQIKPGKIKKKLGKYVEKMLFDMKKNPEKYKIETPRGLMSIEEALQQGYDPATKDFTDKGTKQDFEESLAGLSESGRENIKRITSPSAMQMPESQAAALGVDTNSPMVARAQGRPGMPAEMPEGGPAAQEVSPEILAALGGGQ
jgi:hypothetical protein